MKRLFDDALDFIADSRDMLSDWKSDWDKSDDIQGVLRFMRGVFRVVKKRGKVGLKQLWGTGLGFLLIITLSTYIIPFPKFEEGEPVEQAVDTAAGQSVENPIEQTSDSNAEITARAKMKRSDREKAKEPMDWEVLIGFAVLVICANFVCLLIFWRKDRKKANPENIQKRLREADKEHRERRRNIMLEMFKSQGLDLREVKNPNRLADDVANEMEENDGDLGK